MRLLSIFQHDMRNKDDKKWKIFIVSHKEIYSKMFAKDKDFNHENYVFLNVGENNLIGASGYQIINQKNLKNYVCLGKWWAESEGIYNIWKSKNYTNLDYIGFLHYDKEFRLVNSRFSIKKNNITERICRYLRHNDEAHISFETHNTLKDYNQHIMADINRPNELTGDGMNCYDYILCDYNTYFGKNKTLDDFFDKKYINLCSCFMLDISHFEEMMAFFDWVVTSKKLECFDTKHKHRLQGGLAERYFGVYLLFAYDKMLDLSIAHVNLK